MANNGKYPMEPTLDDRVLVDLAGKIGKEWQTLGITLGLTKAKIDHIKANNPLYVGDQILDMLITWQRTLGREADAVSILAEGLTTVGRTDLAEELLDNRMTKTRSPNRFNPTALREELVDHYLSSTCQIPTHPLFPAWVRNMKGIYVDLHLVDETNQPPEQPAQLTTTSPKLSTRGSISLHKTRKVDLKSHEDLVVLDGPGRYRILLKGRPGSGKSTIVKKVTYDWSSQQRSEDKKTDCEPQTAVSDDKPASGTYSPLSKFELVFPLKLNQVTGKMTVIDAIFDQILPRDTKVSKSDLKTYIENHQEAVLLLLDGLDELPASILEAREGTNDLKDVLMRRALRRCCVIVTSRHHTADKLLKLYPHFARVETTGFGPRDRDEYVRKYFTGSPDQAKLVTQIESSATLRNLAEIPLLLLMMCLVWANESSLPKRLTELYDHVVRIFLMHQATKRGAPLPDQTEVPDGLIRKLGQVALRGLLQIGEESLSFCAEDFHVEDIAQGCQMGLLIQESVPIGLKVQSVITFLHKTFQELCAASYLADLAKTNRREFNKYISGVTVNNVGNMEYLLRFCCGKSTKAAKLILSHVKKLQKHSGHDEKDESQRLRLLLAFEAGSKKLGSLLSDVTSFPHLKGEGLLSAHCFLQSVRRLTSVKTLSVECTSNSEVGLVMNMLQHTPNIQELICNKVPGSSAVGEASVEIPRLRRLSKMYFLDSSSSRSPSSSLLVPQCIAKQINLSHIHISGVNLHGMLGIIRPNVHVIESLCLSNCGLVCGDMNTLCNALSAAGSLKVLNLSGNRIRGALQALVPIVPRLEKLDMSNCDILSDDANLLSCLLSAASNLRVLSLSNNSMQNRLSVLAPVVPQLDTLHLDYCELVDSDSEDLALMLSSARNLKKLHLLHNNFSNVESIKCMVSKKAQGNIYLLLTYDVFGWTFTF